jgi:proteasome lid subunit RPN8/RPN11
MSRLRFQRCEYLSDFHSHPTCSRRTSQSLLTLMARLYARSSCRGAKVLDDFHSHPALQPLDLVAPPDFDD